MTLRRGIAKNQAEKICNRDVWTKWHTGSCNLNILLGKCSDQGILSREDATVEQLNPLSSPGTIVQIIRRFDGEKHYQS
jgi:hypothetical protein